MTNWIDLLDVSSAQGTIDFHRVAAADVAPGVNRKFRGVFVKVAENETGKDPNRVANIAGARAAGLLWGAYVYVHPMGDMGVEVKNAYEAIGDTMPDFPLALDFEAADPSLTPWQLVDQIRCAVDSAKEWFGRPPIVYSYPSFWASRMMPAAAQCPELASLSLWWAYYGAGVPWYPTREQMPTPPLPWRDVALWQYSGNTRKKAGMWTGHVDGINGDVDRSVYTLGEDAFLYDFCGRPRPDQIEDDRIVRPTDLLP